MKKKIAKRAKKVVLLLGITGLCFSMGGCSKLVKLAAETLKENIEAETEQAVAEDDYIEFESDTEEEETEVEDDTETEEDTASVKTKKPSDYNSQLSDDVYSYSFALDGEVYTIPMWFADFEARGWEFDGDRTLELKSNQYTFSQYWEKGDLRFHTDIANLTPNNATLENSLVSCISLDKGYNFEKDCVIELPGGLFVGESTREDIIAAYGEPTDEMETDYSWVLTYKEDIYNSVKLTVDKEAGCLERVDIENMVALEGGNDEINADAPDEVKNYQAPSRLGDSIYDMQFELDGEMFSLPCPLSYMAEHGFDVPAEIMEMEIGSGQTAVVSIKYGKRSIVCVARNKADYGTLLKNCWVEDVEIDAYANPKSFRCSGGVYIGMPEAEFLKVLEKYDYEKSEEYENYTITNPDDENGYVKVNIDEGEVNSIMIKQRCK